MNRTGVVNLPLHGGKAPKWLFKRMVALSRGIVEVIALEYGKEEFLQRLSDPFWFQAFSCVLGYDWHSSGTTTVTCGALKEALDPNDHGLGIAGGKGKASKKTPHQIEEISNIYNFSTNKIDELKYSSRMVAKVDNTAIQDGHQLYHHVFFLSETGNWAVIQQGMNDVTGYARRYHWFSDHVTDYVCEPHNAILGVKNKSTVLDMTSKMSISTQKTCLDLVSDHPRHLKNDWAKITIISNQKTLDNWKKPVKNEFGYSLDMPRSINWNKMKEIYDFHPKNYEDLLSIRGVGPNTVRALALISDLIYGEKPSWHDPVKYSFTVGGKDGVPFPVDRKAMDESTEILKLGIDQAKIGNRDKLQAIKRLNSYVS